MKIVTPTVTAICITLLTIALGLPVFASAGSASSSTPLTVAFTSLENTQHPAAILGNESIACAPCGGPVAAAVAGAVAGAVAEAAVGEAVAAAKGDDDTAFTAHQRPIRETQFDILNVTAKAI